MNGYVCFYRGKRVEVYAETQLKARAAAAEALNVKPKFLSEITCVLAERDGVPVVHTHDF